WDFRGSVASMGGVFGFWSWAFLRQAQAAAREGLSIFGPAGNDNRDTQGTYPCAYPEVYCVGAVDESYQKLPISNWGSEINYLAPGNRIQTLSNINDNLGRDDVVSTTAASAYAAG